MLTACGYYVFVCILGKFVFGGHCCFCAQRHAKEKEYAYYFQLTKQELTNANSDIVTWLSVVINLYMDSPHVYGTVHL